MISSGVIMMRSPSNKAEHGTEKQPPLGHDAGPIEAQSDRSLPRGGDATILAIITVELKRHAPFTMLGTLSGVVIMAAFAMLDIPHSVSAALFWGLHPLHVLLSALVTTAMFTLHGRHALFAIFSVGYVGSVGIATLSDSIIPYAAEWLLDMPNRGIHLGFIEKWWLVNPMAIAGIFLGWLWPRTKIAHTGHVFLSTWASLFHMTMAMGNDPGILAYAAAAAFLFLAVWIPCCTSDIVFPLIFIKKESNAEVSLS